MIEITFDTSDGFVYDSGIEFVDSTIRLISPDSGRQALYFLVDLTSSVVAAEADWTSSVDIPVDVWVEEPSLDTVRDHQYEFNLGTLWDALRGHSGKVYIGMVLGGTIPVMQKTAPFDPVGYWNFNDGLVSESRNQGLDGINYGATSVDTNRGQGFSFVDGDYISFGNPAELRLESDMTLAFWIYPRSFAARQSVLHKAYGGEMSIVLETNGTLSYYYGTDGGDSTPYQGINSDTAVALNQYTHVALIRNLTDMTLHWVINNRERAQIAALYDYATPSPNNLVIGKGYEGNFDGVLDELVIYDKALEVGDISLLRADSYIRVVDEAVGQMIVSEIRIHLKNVWVPGNVIKESAYAYKGSDVRDTLIRVERIPEAVENFANVTLSADRELLPYIVADPRPEYLDLIVGLPRSQENLFVYINDSFDADWESDGLLGSAMDSRTVSGISSTGISQGESSWILQSGCIISASLSPELESVTLMCVIRKTSLDSADKAYFSLRVGGVVVDIDIDDEDEFLRIKEKVIRKPRFPWTTDYITLKIVSTPTSIRVILFDRMICKMDPSPHMGEAELTLAADCECQLKSFYFGPLSDGEAETVNPESRLIVAGVVSCTGEMYLAGNQRMESIGDLYMVSDNIYLNKEVYAKYPGMYLDDPVLFGIHDTVSGQEHLYYGSKSSYEIYRYDGEYWSLYLEARLFSIWRSLHTEGLVVQLPDEDAIKIHLFKREDGLLTFRKYIAFTGLPDSDYLFEPTLDRRISQKTAPWVWAADTSLEGPA